MSNEKVDPKEVQKLADELESIVASIAKGDEDILGPLIQVIGLPDEQFILLAPNLLQSYKQSLNNPNDKIALAQALNASGTKLEDFTDSFQQIIDEIEKMPISNYKKDFIKEIFSSIFNAASEIEGVSKRYVNIPFELCHPNAKLPQYAHTSDSGMDVYALDDITIQPSETKLVPTGIKVALPPGYELQVRPKSGRALKTKLRIANTPGTIDAGYRDEISIIVENIEPPIKDLTYEFVNGNELKITSILHGSPFTIGKGEKFCQFVLAEVPKVSVVRVESVLQIGEDRGGGFGSTGIK